MKQLIIFLALFAIMAVAQLIYFYQKRHARHFIDKINTSDIQPSASLENTHLLPRAVTPYSSLESSGHIHIEKNSKKAHEINPSPHTRQEKFIDNFGARLKTSWVLFAILVLSFCLGSIGITLLFFVVSFLAFREFISLMGLKSSDYWPIFCAFYIFLPLQYFFIFTDAQFLFYIFIPVYVFLMGPLISVIGQQDNDMFFERTSKFQWAQIACIYCLSYMPAIASMQLKNFQSSSLLLFLMLVLFLSDALQYICGNLWGRKKVAPKLSPNKTVEGTVSGIIIASFLGALLYFLTPFTWWQAGMISFLISMVGFLGGLVISGIKRSLKILDWGDLLGAHGGVLDRLDSFIFTAPLFYHLCKYFYS